MRGYLGTPVEVDGDGQVRGVVEPRDDAGSGSRGRIAGDVDAHEVVVVARDRVTGDAAPQIVVVVVGREAALDVVVAVRDLDGPELGDPRGHREVDLVVAGDLDHARLVHTRRHRVYDQGVAIARAGDLLGPAGRPVRLLPGEVDVEVAVLGLALDEAPARVVDPVLLVLVEVPRRDREDEDVIERIGRSSADDREVHVVGTREGTDGDGEKHEHGGSSS